jgi:hypothetical protein
VRWPSPRELIRRWWLVEGAHPPDRPQRPLDNKRGRKPPPPPESAQRQAMGEIAVPVFGC